MSLVVKAISGGKLMVSGVSSVMGYILFNLSPQGASMGSPPDTGSDDGGVYPSREDSEGLNDRSSRIIGGLLYNTDGLYEIEIHQLAYNLDVFSLEYFGDRLLDAQYKPDYHGVYSEDISIGLQSLSDQGEIEPTADMYEGELVTRYDRTKEVKVDEPTAQIIRHVLSELEDFNMDDLINRTRDHWAREKTEFGEQIPLDPTEFDTESSSAEFQQLFDTPPSDIEDPFKH